MAFLQYYFIQDCPVYYFFIPNLAGLNHALKDSLSEQGEVLFVAILALLALMASNQFIEVPYNAVLFWLVYGALLGCMKKSKEPFNVLGVTK